MTGHTDIRPAGSDRRELRRRTRAGALRAALWYAVLGGLWIIFSDRALGLAVPDPEIQATFQTWKGLIFVALSSLVVGVLAYRELARERAATEQVAHLAELSAAGIYVVQDEEVVVANRRVLEMLGARSAEEVEGHSVFDFVTLEDHHRFEERLGALVAAGRVEPQRIKFRRLDGSPLLVEVEARVVEWRGRRAEICVMFDVTALEEEARRVRTRERLETVGQLTAAISHDLRNLLTAISVPLELAQQALPEGGPGRLEVEEAIVATRRAGKLTRELLAFGRPRQTRPGPIDIAAYLVEVEPMLARAAGPGVELRIETSEELPALQLDPSELSQVLLNLVLNAAEAMEGRGTIDLRTTRLNGSGSDVRLTVADSGPGLHPSVLANLFEPFFTTKASGTGLGLATVKRIVSEAGGSIATDPNYSGGARFVIDLPPSDATADETPPAADMTLDDVRVETPHGRVLLVEDERMVRSAARRALERAGYAVEEADSCSAARRCIEEGAATDVVVVDVGLPDGSGLDLARELDSTVPAPGIVIVSGAADSARATLPEHAIFVEKPFAVQDLVSAISRVRSRS